SHRNQPLASTFLRRNRREIRQMVAKWTGEYEFTLDVVLGTMLRRSRELRLRAVGGDRQLRMDFAVLLTVRTIHFLYSEGRRDWIAL
ncbi:MAG: putative zinc-binding metallopeptidase, partial [Gemmatimonadaceae bacterium]